ncbi:CU044_2847 family protein [Streptomyces sp. NPDC058662]|uniref:CU044_2847 family protein n=1 Tax=Streptomyces sp. NPDC058662 TaxID=3346583 RepID=UPI0036593144
MTHLARISLEGGGSVLVESPATTADGPVKAGRVGDVIQQLPNNLQDAMGSVADASRTVLDQLRKAGPDAISVEFGVNLAVEAGVVITKSSTTCHLRVTMTWKKDEPAGRGAGGPGTAEGWTED